MQANDSAAKKQRAISYALLFICIAAFLGFCSYQIAYPGVQYDEITFSNIALGSKAEHFSFDILGVPIMVMPYIGALKAYLYYPVFALFGVSALAIRLPMIILAAFPLFLGYRVAVRLSNSLWVGNALALMMSTSLCFIISTKMDWGPSSIMMFLIFLTLWAFLRLLDTKKLVYAYVVFLSILAGMYDKSSFIWFGAAFGVSALIFHREFFIQLWKEKGARFRAPFLTFLGIAAVYAAVAIPLLTSMGVSQGSYTFTERLALISSLYRDTLSGASYTGYMFFAPVEFSYFTVYLSIACLIGLAAFCVFSKLPKERMLNYAVLCSTAVIIFLEMAITKEAGGPHHTIMLFPFAMLFIALCGYCLINAFQSKHLLKIAAAAACALALAAVTGLNLQADLWYTGYVSNEDNVYSANWDPHIYELAEYVQASEITNIYSVDWGTNNQLYAFDTKRDAKSYIELKGFFDEYGETPESEKELRYNEYFYGKDVLLVTKGEGMFNFPAVAGGFEAFQKEFPDKSFELIHTIDNAAGQPLYLVYRAA